LLHPLAREESKPASPSPNLSPPEKRAGRGINLWTSPYPKMEILAEGFFYALPFCGKDGLARLPFLPCRSLPQRTRH